jgi:uncharacterized membrane protein
MNTSSKNKKNFLLLAIIATLAAVGIHIYLTLHFYEVKFGLGDGGSVCNINAVFNCDAVTASQFSSFLGLPIALWGVFTNLILAYFMFITYKNLTQDSEKTSRYTFLIASITLLASLVMGLISLTAMKNLCLFCIATYGLSIISFIGPLTSAKDLSFNQLKNDILDLFFSERWVLGLLLIIPVFSFGSNLIYLDTHGLGEVEKIAAEKFANWQASPIEKFEMSTGLSFQSENTNPVMTIIEFADFRCSHCKHAAPSLHAFAKSHSDVRFIFKPYPLDGTCNDGIHGGGDGISCGLAFAVMCAEKLNKKGWAAHDYLFEIQNQIIQDQSLDKNIDTLSTALSMNRDDLKKCIDSEEIKNQVKTMAKEGTDAKIHGTPSIFVNGKLLSGGQMLPILEVTYRNIKF